MNARFKKALAIARRSKKAKPRKLARHLFARTQTTTDEWLTPRYIIEALGPFELDPCASIVRPWPTAAYHYTIEDDGLAQSWRAARVWMNPPYGIATPKWMKRLREHGNGIALVAVRANTKWFHAARKAATAVLFLEGKIAFCKTDGTSGQQACFASIFFAFGEANARALKRANDAGTLPGWFITNEQKAAA